MIQRSQDETYFSYNSDDPEATFKDDHCMIGKAHYLIAELFKIQGTVQNRNTILEHYQQADQQFEKLGDKTFLRSASRLIPYEWYERNRR